MFDTIKKRKPHIICLQEAFLLFKSENRPKYLKKFF